MWKKYSSSLLKDCNIYVNLESYFPCGLEKIGVGARDIFTCFTSNHTLCTDDNQASFISYILTRHMNNIPKNIQNLNINNITHYSRLLSSYLFTMLEDFQVLDFLLCRILFQ